METSPLKYDPSQEWRKERVAQLATGNNAAFFNDHSDNIVKELSQR